MAHQIWESEDKKKQGTLAEIERYEDGLKSPLSRMRFPYTYDHALGNNQLFHEVSAGDKAGTFIREPEMRSLVAFANLTPLIAEWRKERTESLRSAWSDATRKLADAYDEAVDLIPKP